MYFELKIVNEKRRSEINMAHISVLVDEVIKYLSPRPGENFIDGTCGAAGHTEEILKEIGAEGKILCLDLDAESLRRAQVHFEKSEPEQLIFIEGNFADIEKIIQEGKIFPIDGILVDLGMSSEQLEESGRGFSFLKDEPLDMRYCLRQGLSAREIVNYWPQQEIEKILKEYGEERHAWRISQQIVSLRKAAPIRTTRELIGVVAQAVPAGYRYGRIHFATRTFQALRIAVNNELENLKKFLPQAVNILKSGGRLAVISFHSLEDRIVKNFFRQKARQEEIKILTKKPVLPTVEEIAKNPRSRSAKLRAIIKK